MNINKHLKYINVQIVHKTELRKTVAIVSTVGTSILAAAYLLNESQHRTKHRSRAKFRKVQENLSTC
jgi:hypothetical protein